MHTQKQSVWFGSSPIHVILRFKIFFWEAEVAFKLYFQLASK